MTVKADKIIDKVEAACARLVERESFINSTCGRLEQLRLGERVSQFDEHQRMIKRAHDDWASSMAECLVHVSCELNKLNRPWWRKLLG